LTGKRKLTLQVLVSSVVGITLLVLATHSLFPARAAFQAVAIVIHGPYMRTICGRWHFCRFWCLWRW